jgi:hypothetical protein
MLNTNASPYSTVLTKKQDQFAKVIQPCKDFMLNEVFDENSPNFHTLKRDIDRSVTIAYNSLECIEAFVRAELDCATPGSRGIGRFSDIDYPRLASILKDPLNNDVRKSVGWGIETLLINGIVAGSLFETIHAKNIADWDIETINRSPEEIWNLWIPTLIDGIPVVYSGFIDILEFTLTPTISNYWEPLIPLIAKDNEKFMIMAIFYGVCGMQLYYANTNVSLRFLETGRVLINRY